MDPIPCPRCRSKHVVKNGRYASGGQRLLCGECGAIFPEHQLRRGYPAWIKCRAVQFFLNGLSVETVAELNNVSVSTVRSWIKKYSNPQQPLSRIQKKTPDYDAFAAILSQPQLTKMLHQNQQRPASKQSTFIVIEREHTPNYQKHIFLGLKKTPHY